MHRGVTLAMVGSPIVGATVMLSPPAGADICPYPGVGVGVNVLVSRGGFCDYPTEVNGAHMHCETGGAGLGGGFGINGEGIFSGALGGAGISGASCTWRCPDNTLAPQPNPPGMWSQYLVPEPVACAEHMTPAGHWSEPVRPEEGPAPQETDHLTGGAPGPP